MELAMATVVLGGQTILSDLSFRLNQGDVAVLLGASGCGKTTFLHLLGGLLPPARGRVLWDDDDIFQKKRGLELLRGRTVGFVFQRPLLFGEMTVGENVQFPGRIAGLANCAERARELLAAVGLADRINSVPRELSGGEQQRVAIARALLCRPPFLLADEPTGNLDGEAAEWVRNLLFSLPRELGSGLLVATHNSCFLAGAGRVLRLERQRLVEGAA
jgi:ABC-type lipoprotein export system ATPase subunit